MLFFEVKPQVTVPYREVRQTIGSDTLLECRIRSNPTGDIYWEREGKRLETVPDRYRVFTTTGSDDSESFLSLVIYKLRSEDFAWYTCVAKNPLGSAIDSAVISGKTSIIIRPIIMHVHRSLR